MKKQIITLAVAALLLSSCGIYTKYECTQLSRPPATALYVAEIR